MAVSRSNPSGRRQNNYNDNSTGTAADASSADAGPAAAAAPQLDADPPAAPPASGVDNYNTALPAPPAASATRPQSSATGKNYSFQYDDGSSASGPALNPPSPSTAAGGDAAISSTVPAAPAGLPLHERLKIFRQSPFGDTAQTTPSPVNPPRCRRAGGTRGDSARRDTGGCPARHRPPQRRRPRLCQAPRLTPSRNICRPPSRQRAAAPSDQPPAETLPSSRPTAEPQHLATAKPANDAAQEPSVLIDHKSPLLSVETIGPRKIVVGKEAAYEVLLQNSGDVAAEEVTVTVSLPDWAEVAGASASSGEVRPIEQDRHDPCRWVLGRIEARSKEKLALKIIPRQSKPFELAVRWDFKQAPSQAMIEVQEPKLTMRLDGPREVFFGKREVYKLKLGNSGNGAAENVVLTLMPLNAGDTHPITHRLGTINAGDERSIEIELTARQAGNLTIRVEANGDGGAHVDLAEHVLVHRAALQVDVEGPAVQFVGTPAHYKIHVRNPGDALAKNVKLTAKLPTGVKFVSGSDGATAEDRPSMAARCDGRSIRCSRANSGCWR